MSRRRKRRRGVQLPLAKQRSFSQNRLVARTCLKALGFVKVDQQLISSVYGTLPFCHRGNLALSSLPTPG